MSLNEGEEKRKGGKEGKEANEGGEGKRMGSKGRVIQNGMGGRGA